MDYHVDALFNKYSGRDASSTVIRTCAKPLEFRVTSGGVPLLVRLPEAFPQAAPQVLLAGNGMPLPPSLLPRWQPTELLPTFVDGCFAAVSGLLSGAGISTERCNAAVAFAEATSAGVATNLITADPDYAHVVVGASSLQQDLDRRLEEAWDRIDECANGNLNRRPALESSAYRVAQLQEDVAALRDSIQRLKAQLGDATIDGALQRYRDRLKELERDTNDAGDAFVKNPPADEEVAAERYVCARRQFHFYEVLLRAYKANRAGASPVAPSPAASGR
jgi:hypothetical protein